MANPVKPNQTIDPPLRTNRLGGEKSPYLLQHRFNPVDWYPWGEGAFALARSENKPIFLSIGYSTCHWCHVMERESFENATVADLLNRHFISIKVDREERPDVDKIYMTFVQATTGQGGWPLNVFLTPDLKPFYGGTYFPPEPRHGRPGLPTVLEQVEKLWRTRREDITQSAVELHARLEHSTAIANPAAAGDLSAGILQLAGTQLKEAFDARHGGFGSAPKFPQPSQPQFLLRYARRFQDEEAVRMVLTTCDRMAAGGIHDQLGGGFARYSVDAEWLVPHFEKMLYDNAQLAQLYLDAYLVSNQPGYAAIVRDILDYVRRDMTHPQGGFYSAEDADSEGHEGKFYCWTSRELSGLLSPEEFNVAVRYFGITEQGNFLDHSHPRPLLGQNVLSIVAPDLGAADAGLLASARQKMLAVRAQRVRPHLDDKILASWNGLMLGAMARASVVLDDATYRAAAERNLAFLRQALWDASTRTLYHRWRDGERDEVQLLEGYAFLLAGTIDLYEATLTPNVLEFAISLAESMLARFYDADDGGFYQTVPGASDLILRLKEIHDGAEPSGNSVAILGLMRLGRITGRKDFLNSAEESLRLFSQRVQQAPHAFPYLLQALDFSLQEPQRIVIAGAPDSADAVQLRRAAHAVFQGNKVVLGNTGPVDPFAATLDAPAGVLAYLCTGTACQPPTRDPETLRAQLRG